MLYEFPDNLSCNENISLLVHSIFQFSASKVMSLTQKMIALKLQSHLPQNEPLYNKYIKGRHSFPINE